MSSTPANQDPALAPPPPATAPPAGAPASDSAAPPHLLDSAQIVQLLRHFPSVYQVSLPPSVFPPFVSSPSWQRRPHLRVRVGSSGITYRFSACLHVILGEVTVGARSRVSQVPTGLSLPYPPKTACGGQ